MPYVPRENSLADEVKELRRQVNNLNSIARIGLNQIKFGFQDTGVGVATYGTWFTNDGTTTLPSVTVVTGVRAIVECGALLYRFGDGVNVRSNSGLFGYGINGVNPDDLPSGSNAKRAFAFQGVTVIEITQSFTSLVDGMTPGENVFQMYAWADDLNGPSALLTPQFDDSWIMVLPIDV